MIHIYSCDDIYLYEIIEDYKSANFSKKDEIFTNFCDSIWHSENKRRTYKKHITFSVAPNILNTEIGQVFDIWSSVEYRYYKVMTKDGDWQSIIRQKINNLYTRYFDKNVILSEQYMNLLKTPKKLYYDYLHGVDMDSSELTAIIDNAMDNANNLKIKLQKEKMSLSWVKYKKIIEEFLRKAFDNCKLIEDFEDKTKLNNIYDFMTEDLFYVGYINKTLEGELMKYQKRYYGLPQNSRKGYIRCKLCGDMIVRTNNKKMYCEKCANAKEKYRKRNNAYKYRKVAK